MSKYFFQTIFDVLTGQPTPAEKEATSQVQAQATTAIQSISAAIPPPPPPPALAQQAAVGAEAAGRAAAAAGAGFGGTLATTPQGAAVPSTTSGKALLGQ